MTAGWWQRPNDALGRLAASLVAGASRRQVADATLHEDARYDRLFRLVPRHPTAMTFGSTIVARRRLDAASIAHELAHVAQYRRFGPLYLIVYLAGASWGWLRHGDSYAGNPFEARAMAAERTGADDTAAQ
ncbi:MAG: DUF4157 domain-containing protein [Chloroflexota bacterium]|nr:DUF4157 domain-containing protein [Chloroflexota bacterium]